VPRPEILEDRPVPSGYQQINLVGELPAMAHRTDPHLDGWAMDYVPNGPSWWRIPGRFGRAPRIGLVNVKFFSFFA
jgi:hypothetical protein